MDKTSKKCLNCNEVLADNECYCHHCGQSSEESKRPIKELLLDVINSLLGFDGRLVNTLKKLFVPAYLPKAFIEGKRMSYLPPTRLFIIGLVLHISALLYISNFGELDSNTGSFQVEKAKLAMRYDTIASSVFDSTEIEKQIAFKYELFDTLTADSIFFKGVWASFLDAKVFTITNRDVYTLSPEKIIEKYEITGFKEKLFVKQFVKLNSNRAQAMRFGLANLLWSILAVIILLAFVMKLLYWRSKRFYIEHLTLLLHTHAVTFIFTSLCIVFGYVLENDMIIFLGYLVSIIYFLISLKKYYGQGKFKTFAKFMILAGFYFMIFVIVAIVVGGLSLAIF
jgi:hypothetical protein